MFAYVFLATLKESQIYEFKIKKNDAYKMIWYVNYIYYNLRTISKKNEGV